MPYRSRSEIARLSGNPAAAPPPEPPRETGRVFRRFFDLIERLERPPVSGAATPAAKAGRAPERGGRR